MARPKIYTISLTDDELMKLKAIIRRKNTSKTIKCRCQILIDLDEAHGNKCAHTPAVCQIEWSLHGNSDKYSETVC